MGRIPPEIRKAAHILLQKKLREYGGFIPEGDKRDIAILEKIAYLEIGGIHSAEEHKETTIESIRINLPEGENDAKSRKIKNDLEIASFNIDKKNILKILGKNKKLISMILEHFGK